MVKDLLVNKNNKIKIKDKLIEPFIEFEDEVDSEEGLNIQEELDKLRQQDDIIKPVTNSKPDSKDLEINRLTAEMEKLRAELDDTSDEPVQIDEGELSFNDYFKIFTYINSINLRALKDDESLRSKTKDYSGLITGLKDKPYELKDEWGYAELGLSIKGDDSLGAVLGALELLINDNKGYSVKTKVNIEEAFNKLKAVYEKGVNDYARMIITKIKSLDDVTKNALNEAALNEFIDGIINEAGLIEGGELKRSDLELIVNEELSDYSKKDSLIKALMNNFNKKPYARLINSLKGSIETWEKNPALYNMLKGDLLNDIITSSIEKVYAKKYSEIKMSYDDDELNKDLDDLAIAYPKRENFIKLNLKKAVNNVLSKCK